MNKPLVLGAAAVAIVGAVGAWLTIGQGGALHADTAAEGGANESTAGAENPEDWRKKWASLGLKAGLAARPDVADSELKAAARAAADPAGVASLIAGFVTSGVLRDLSASRPRRHPMRGAATLLKQLREKSAKPAAEVEVAWLVATLLDHTTASPPAWAFVTEGDGVQTPVLLSRARVAVQVGAQVIDTGTTKLVKPTVVTARKVATWWLIQKAYVHRGAREFDAAHALLAAAVDLGGADSAANFARCVVELDQGVIDRGLDRCNRALATEDDPMARLFLSDVLNQLERPFKAWQQVQHVLRTHPNLAEAHASKGIVEASRVATLPESDKPAKLAEAEASLRKALKLDPKVAGARAGLAQVLLLKGDTEAAEKLLVDAVDGHQDAAAAGLLGELWRTPEKNGALIAKLAPLAKTGDLRVILALVSAHAAGGDLEAAMKVAEAAYKQQPDDAQLGLLRADLLRQTGKPDQAIEALDKLRGADDTGQVTLLQAQLLLQQERSDRAIALLEPLAEKGKQRKQASMLLLMAYKQAKRDTAAQALIKRLQDAGEMTAEELAGTLIEMNDAEGAIAILEAANKRPKPTLDAAQMLAMIYTAAGRKEDAERLRDRLVAAAGADAETWKAKLTEAIDGASAELQAMAEEDAQRRPEGEAADKNAPKSP